MIPVYTGHSDTDSKTHEIQCDPTPVTADLKFFILLLEFVLSPGVPDLWIQPTVDQDFF